MRLHGNPSSRAALICGQTDGRTDGHNEAIGASRDYANAPNRNPSNGLRADTN
jgi:hypothetical protein